MIMKVRNISAKIVGVGGKMIMPGDEVEFEITEKRETQLMVNDNLFAMERMGMLALTNAPELNEKGEVVLPEKKTKAKVKVEADVEEEASEVTEKKPTRGRKKKEEPTE